MNEACHSRQACIVLTEQADEQGRACTRVNNTNRAVLLLLRFRMTCVCVNRKVTDSISSSSIERSKCSQCRECFRAPTNALMKN